MPSPLSQQRPRGTVLIQEPDDVILPALRLASPLTFRRLNTNQDCGRFRLAKLLSNLESNVERHVGCPCSILVCCRGIWYLRKPRALHNPVQRLSWTTKCASPERYSVARTLEDLANSNHNRGVLVGEVVVADTLVVLLESVRMLLIPKQGLCDLSRERPIAQNRRSQSIQDWAQPTGPSISCPAHARELSPVPGAFLASASPERRSLDHGESQTSARDQCMSLISRGQRARKTHSLRSRRSLGI